MLEYFRATRRRVDSTEYLDSAEGSSKIEAGSLPGGGA